MKKQNTDDGWWQFLELCTHVKTAEDFHDFFDLFLTKEEQEDIGTRCLIIRDLLQEEKTQREMAEALSVSISKITRGSNYLKLVGDKLRRFLIKRMT